MLYDAVFSLRIWYLSWLNELFRSHLRVTPWTWAGRRSYRITYRHPYRTSFMSGSIPFWHIFEWYKFSKNFQNFVLAHFPSHHFSWKFQNFDFGTLCVKFSPKIDSKNVPKWNFRIFWEKWNRSKSENLSRKQNVPNKIPLVYYVIGSWRINFNPTNWRWNQSNETFDYINHQPVDKSSKNFLP